MDIVLYLTKHLIGYFSSQTYQVVTSLLLNKLLC